METYSFLREFADSWFLIAMFTFFLGTWVFAFWPGARSAREDAANIPMRDDDDLTHNDNDDLTCKNDCANCVCGHDFLEGPSNE